EKVTIPWDKECIVLEGSGSGQTRITWNGHGQTDTTATFTAAAANFVAKGIAFENSYDMPVVQQNWVPAVAARIYGDKSSFHRCAFIGFQDTLWDVQGRHYFNSCSIEGAVDFIWGSGQSFYEDCLIKVTAGLAPPQRLYAGYITAQGRQSAKDSSGFVFERGSVFGIGKAYLGRAYGPHSRVVFHGTELGALVVPDGWDAWHYKGSEQNFMYAEANCRGAGAGTSRRVRWERTRLDVSELQEFSRDKFIDQDRWLGNQPSA
ncbi:hypothetical protein C3L33_21437, partial [Rhododendron williamsianum]